MASSPENSGFDSKLENLLAKVTAVEESSNSQTQEHEARIAALEARFAASEARCLALETIVSRLKQSYCSMGDMKEKSPLNVTKKAHMEAECIDAKSKSEQKVRVESMTDIGGKETREISSKECANPAHNVKYAAVQSIEGETIPTINSQKNVTPGNDRHSGLDEHRRSGLLNDDAEHREESEKEDTKMDSVGKRDEKSAQRIPRTVDETVPKGYAVFLPEGFRVCTKFSSVVTVQEIYGGQLKVVACPLHDNLAVRSFAMVHVVLFNVPNKTGNDITTAIGAFENDKNAKNAMNAELAQWSEMQIVDQSIVCDKETVAKLEIRLAIL